LNIHSNFTHKSPPDVENVDRLGVGDGAAAAAAAAWRRRLRGSTGSQSLPQLCTGFGTVKGALPAKRKVAEVN